MWPGAVIRWRRTVLAVLALLTVGAAFVVLHPSSPTGGIRLDPSEEPLLPVGDPSRDVYADRGYPSEERAAWLKANGFRNQIQRKGQRNKPLSECQQRRNTRIARTRARVEHPFAAIAQMGGKLIRTIGQARASFAMTMMAACYNLKRLTYFQKAGVVAF